MFWFWLVGEGGDCAGLADMFGLALIPYLFDFYNKSTQFEYNHKNLPLPIPSLGTSAKSDCSLPN